MSSIEFDDKWERYYREGTSPWERGEPNPVFLQWLESGAMPPCRIIVPGCGRSPEPGVLARRGFTVTALDAAPSAIAAQKEMMQARDYTLDLVQDSIFTWSPDAPMDAIYEQTCLCAIYPDERAAYEAQVYKWLKPGGRLYAMFMQSGNTDQTPYHCAIEDMKTLFAADRWTWPEDEPPQSPHPKGGVFELGYILERK